MITFDTAFDRLIGHEGGYVNDPKDPGGETNWGISKRSYPHLNIKALTREDARAIYLRDFWNAVGDGVHPAVKFQVFDFAVNSGIGTAIRKLQAAVGAADDGQWGAVSDARARAMGTNDVLFRFIAERLDFWRKLSGWPRFGAGWVARAAANLRYAADDNDDPDHPDADMPEVHLAATMLPMVERVTEPAPTGEGFRFVDPHAS